MDMNMTDELSWLTPAQRTAWAAWRVQADRLFDAIDGGADPDVVEMLEISTRTLRQQFDSLMRYTGAGA